jgi:O-antigen/teichoic acid export membrane protein
MAYCRIVKFLKNAKIIYLPARGAGTALSLAFAVLYSRELGVINRGYVAAIMSFTVLTLILFTSGTTLTLRNLGPEGKLLDNFPAFLSLIFLEGLLGLLTFFIGIQAFSNFKDPLPIALISISMIYFVASGMHLISMEILIAFNFFKQASKLEILSIILQISFYLLLALFTPLTIATRLLMSFILASLIITLLTLRTIHKVVATSAFFGNPGMFLKKTKGNHSIGTVLGVIDRFDRIIITWFLPVALLAKYSVMSSFISFFRFIPDAISKIIVSLKIEYAKNVLGKLNLVIYLIVPFSVLMILLSRIAISKLLGDEWLLPWGITILFALQELLRGGFQVSGIFKISVGDSALTHRLSLALGIFAVPLSIISTLVLGIYGVPIGFILTYMTLLLVLILRKGHSIV